MNALASLNYAGTLVTVAEPRQNASQRKLEFAGKFQWRWRRRLIFGQGIRRSNSVGRRRELQLYRLDCIGCSSSTIGNRSQYRTQGFRACAEAERCGCPGFGSIWLKSVANPALSVFDRPATLSAPVKFHSGLSPAFGQSARRRRASASSDDSAFDFRPCGSRVTIPAPHKISKSTR